jgi:hypothetical protein
MPLFLFIFTLIEQTYNILYKLLVEHHSCCPHCFPLGRWPPLGAEPRFEPGPAVQQAGATRVRCGSDRVRCNVGVVMKHLDMSLP